MRWGASRVVKGFRMMFELRLDKLKSDTIEREKLTAFQHGKSNPEAYFSLSDLRNAGTVKGSIRKAVSLGNII